MNDSTADRENGHDDGIDIENRTRRALEEPLSVLSVDGTPIDDADASIVSVVSHSGEQYTVDIREGRCSCPDAKHNLDDDERCKHERRARAVLRREPVDARVLDAVDADPQLGQHAFTPAVATADGGIVAGDGAELVDDDAAPTWKGPFTETDKYGEPTGEQYVRCTGCGVEVLAGDTRHATHRVGCDGPEE